MVTPGGGGGSPHLTDVSIPLLRLTTHRKESCHQTMRGQKWRSAPRAQAAPSCFQRAMPEAQQKIGGRPCQVSFVAGNSTSLSVEEQLASWPNDDELASSVNLKRWEASSKSIFGNEPQRGQIGPGWVGSSACPAASTEMAGVQPDWADGRASRLIHPSWPQAGTGEGAQEHCSFLWQGECAFLLDPRAASKDGRHICGDHGAHPCLCLLSTFLDLYLQMLSRPW